jgi:hypothetical protein
MIGKMLATLLIGLGAGTIAGAYLGPAGVWAGVVVAVVGIGMSAVGRGRPSTGDGPGAGGTEDDRPALSGLSTRVEQILRLAEQQADDHRDGARQEAERILAEARAEAAAIMARARGEAGAPAEPQKPDASGD